MMGKGDGVFVEERKIVGRNRTSRSRAARVHQPIKAWQPVEKWGKSDECVYIKCLCVFS
jgi:hypothetical protein